MFKKILVACDNSEGSNVALKHAFILAKKLDAKLTAVWVRGSLPHYPETIDEVEEEEDSAWNFFQAVESRVSSASAHYDWPAKVEMLKGHPAGQIVEHAQKGAFDLVVLGSRGHSRLWGQLLGHTADRVTEQAHCSVLVVRSEKEEAQYRKMLIGYDASESSITALNCGLQLAKRIGSEVEVLWVHPAPASPNATADEARRNDEWARKFFEASIDDSIESTATKWGIKAVRGYRVGSPPVVLVTEAEVRGFRLIVLGHKGHSGLWGRFLGGTADRVSHHAHCDMLIVR